MDKDAATVPVEEPKQTRQIMPLNKGKPSVYIPKDLSVVLSAKAFTQLFAWAYATRLEVSCLGIVSKKGYVFTVQEFFLVDQVSTGAHTDMNPEALAKLVESLHASGRDDDGQKLRCWAHSHPGSMGTFWSTTDKETARTLVSDYLVSIVVGAGFEVRARLDLGSPVAVTIDQIPVYWIPSSVVHDWDEVQKEVSKKVIEDPLFCTPVKEGQKTLEQIDAEESYCVVCDGWHERGQCPFKEMYGLGLHDCLGVPDLDPTCWNTPF